uniref:Uncharacterized protein n=1 Tax=Ditylenchus dipsaci TaxID=166011 RepID=A0A915D2X3_9BILA
MVFRGLLCLSVLFLLPWCLVEAYRGELPSQFALPLGLNGHPYFQMGIKSPKQPTNWTLARSDPADTSSKYEKYFLQKLDQTNPNNKRLSISAIL